MTNPFKPDISLEECLGTELRKVRGKYRDVFDVYHKGGFDLKQDDYCRLLVDALKTDEQLLAKVIDPDLCKTVDAQQLRLRFRRLKDIDKMALNSDLICEKLIPYLQDQLVQFGIDSLRENSVKLRNEVKSLEEAISKAKLESSKQKLAVDLREKQALKALVQDNLRKSKFLLKNNKLELFTAVLFGIVSICNNVAPIPSKMFGDKQQRIISGVLDYFVEDTSDSLKLTTVAREATTKEEVFRSLDFLAEDGSLDPRKVCLDGGSDVTANVSPQVLEKQKMLLKGLQTWVKTMSQLLNEDVSQLPAISSTLQQLQNNVTRLESGQVVDVKDSYQEINPDLLKEVKRLFAKKVNSYQKPIKEIQNLLPNKKQRNALTAAYNQCVEEAKQLLRQQSSLRDRLPIPLCFDQIEIALDIARQQVQMQKEDVVSQFRMSMAQHLETEESFATILSTQLGPQVSTQLQLSQLQDFVVKQDIKDVAEARQRWETQFIDNPAIHQARRDLSQQFLENLLHDVTMRNVDSDCQDKKTELMNKIVACQGNLGDGREWNPCLKSIWMEVNGYQSECPEVDTPLQIPSKEVDVINFRSRMDAYLETEKKYIDILKSKLGDQVSLQLKLDDMQKFVDDKRSVLSSSTLDDIQQQWQTRFIDNAEIRQARKNLSNELLVLLLNQVMMATVAADCDDDKNDVLNQIIDCQGQLLDSDGSSWLPCLRTVWKAAGKYKQSCPEVNLSIQMRQDYLNEIETLKRGMIRYLEDEERNVQILSEVLGLKVRDDFNLDSLASYVKSATARLVDLEDKLNRNLSPAKNLDEMSNQWDSAYRSNPDRYKLHIQKIKAYLDAVETKLQSTSFKSLDVCNKTALIQSILDCKSKMDVDSNTFNHWPACFIKVATDYRTFVAGCERTSEDDRKDMMKYIDKQRNIARIVKDVLQIKDMSVHQDIGVTEMTQVAAGNPTLEEWNRLFVNNDKLSRVRLEWIRKAVDEIRKQLSNRALDSDFCRTEKQEILAGLEDCPLNPDCLTQVYDRYKIYILTCIEKQKDLDDIQRKADKTDLEELKREILKFKSDETSLVDIISTPGFDEASEILGYDEMVTTADAKVRYIDQLLSEIDNGGVLESNTVSQLRAEWDSSYGSNEQRKNVRVDVANAYITRITDYLESAPLDRESCASLLTDLNDQIQKCEIRPNTFPIWLACLLGISQSFNNIVSKCLPGDEATVEVGIADLKKLKSLIEAYVATYRFNSNRMKDLLNRELEIDRVVDVADKLKSKIDKSIESKKVEKLSSIQDKWNKLVEETTPQRNQLEREALQTLQQRVTTMKMNDEDLCEKIKQDLLSRIGEELKKLDEGSYVLFPRVGKLIDSYRDWRTGCNPVGKPSEILATMTKDLQTVVDLYFEAADLMETCKQTKIDPERLKLYHLEIYEEMIEQMRFQMQLFQESIGVANDEDDKEVETIRDKFYKNYDIFTKAMLGTELEKLLEEKIDEDTPRKLIPGKTDGVIQKLKTMCVEKKDEFEAKFKPVKIDRKKLEKLILNNQCQDLLTKDMQAWMVDGSDNLAGKMVYCFQPGQFNQMPDEGDRIGNYIVARKWSSGLGMALAPKTDNIISRLVNMPISAINFILNPIYTLLGTVASLVRRGLKYLRSKLWFLMLVAATAMLILVSKDAMSVEKYLELSLQYGLKTVTVMIQMISEICASNYSLPTLAVTLFLILNARYTRFKDSALGGSIYKATETVTIGFFTKIIIPLLTSVCAVNRFIKPELFKEVGDVLPSQLNLDAIKEFLQKASQTVGNATSTPDSIPLSWNFSTQYLVNNMKRFGSYLGQFVPNFNIQDVASNVETVSMQPLVDLAQNIPAFDIEVGEMAAQTALMGEVDPVTVSFSYEALQQHANTLFSTLAALYAGEMGDMPAFANNILSMGASTTKMLITAMTRFAPFAFNQVSQYFNLGITITLDEVVDLGAQAAPQVVETVQALAAAAPITVSAVAQAPVCAIPTVTSILANPCPVIAVEAVETLTTTIYDQGAQLMTTAVQSSSWTDYIGNIPITSDIMMYGLSILGMLAGSFWIYKLLAPYFRKRKEDIEDIDIENFQVDLSAIEPADLEIDDDLDLSDTDFVSAQSDFDLSDIQIPPKPLPSLPVKVTKPLPSLPAKPVKPLPSLPTVPTVEVVDVEEVEIPQSEEAPHTVEVVSTPTSTLSLTKNEFLTKVQNQIEQGGCPIDPALRKPVEHWDESVVDAISSQMQCVAAVEPNVAKASEELALLAAAKKAVQGKAVAQIIDQETGRVEGHVSIDGTVTAVPASIPLATLPEIQVQPQTQEQLKPLSRKMFADIVKKVLESVPIPQKVELIRVQRKFPADFHFIWVYKTKVQKGDQVLASHKQQRLVYRYIPPTQKIVQIFSTNFDPRTDTKLK